MQDLVLRWQLTVYNNNVKLVSEVEHVVTLVPTEHTEQITDTCYKL